MTATLTEQPEGGTNLRVGSVRKFALLIILVQTGFVALLTLTSGYFADDYLFVGLGQQGGFSGDEIARSTFGSFAPAFQLGDVLLGSLRPVPRWPAIVVVVLIYFATMLAFYKLLELVFGNRPIILAMIIGAGFCGVLATSLEWWTASLNSFPAVLLDILALIGLIRHSVTGKRSYLWFSIVAFALGIQFYEADSTFGAVLFVFDLLFLSVGTTWRSRLVSTLRPWWKWLAFLVPVVFDFGRRALHSTEYALPPTQGPSAFIRFIGIGWAQGFSPMILGIDYPTLSHGWERGVALVGAQLVLVAVVIYTCIRRRLAWRAWVMFFTGFAALEVVAGVGRAYYGAEYAVNPVYWTLQPFVLVFTIGLACLPNGFDPLRGRESPKRVHARRAFPARGRELSLLARGVIAVVLVAVAAAGINEMWSAPTRAQGALNRSYVAVRVHPGLSPRRNMPARSSGTQKFRASCRHRFLIHTIASLQRWGSCCHFGSMPLRARDCS